MPSDGASPAMDGSCDRLTVLQAKFAAYLSWSQPFIHNLVSGVGEHVRNVVICNRTENPDRFPTPSIVRLKTRYLMNPALAVLAAAYVQRAWKPHVIHAHFGWSGIRMLLLKQFLRIPLVTTFGGRDVAVQMHLPYFDRLYQILLEASDQIICVSEDLKKQVVEHGVDPDRIEVVRRGTDLRRFSFVDRSERNSDGPVQILMVGRLVEKKGHRYAFEALAPLLKEGLRFHLTIVGEGEDYHRLSKLRDRLGLRESVTFIGVINHEGVRQHMMNADVFLHCSVTGSDGDCEGIPNVVVEAAATGLPVVGTRHGGIVEPVRHEQTGILVEERDVAGLRDALRRLVLDRERRSMLGHNGSAYTRAEFDLDKQIARHVAIYECLAAAYAPGIERTRRMWIPEDFPDTVDKTLLYKRNAKEFSLAELAESLVGVDQFSAGLAMPEPGLLDKCYDLKRYLPRPIKFPLKLLLGRALLGLFWLRRRTWRRMQYQRWFEHRRALDYRVLEYFREGGDLDRVESKWTVDDLEELLTEHSGDQRPRQPLDAAAVQSVVTVKSR